MKNIKIATKIWISIALIICGYISAVFLTALHNSYTMKQVRHIDVEARPFSEQCTQLFYEFNTMNNAYETAAVIGDMSYLDVAQEYAKRFVATEKSLSEYSGIPEDIQSFIPALQNDLYELLVLEDNTYADMFAMMGDPSDDLLKRLKELAGKRTALKEQIDELRGIAGRHLGEEVQALRLSTARQSRVQIIAFVLIMMMAVPLTTFVINKYILHPLSRLIGYVHGEKKPEESSFSSDEIGELFGSFVKFKKAQQEYTDNLESEIHARKEAENQLRSHQENLEEIIKIRTKSINEANLKLQSSEKQLKSSESRFRTVFQSMNEGLCLNDIILDENNKPVDYRIVMANPSYESIFGISCKDAVGAMASELYNQDVPPFLDVYTKLMESGQSIVFDLYFEPAAKHLSISAARAGENRFAMIFADVSTQKQAELELQQTQKLESVGQLAAGIAHEINTPIQFIGDNIRFIRDAFADLINLQAQQDCFFQMAEKLEIESTFLDAVKDARNDADFDFLSEEIPNAAEQSLEGVMRVSKIVQAMKEFAHPALKEMQSTNINEAIGTTVTITSSEWKHVADLAMDLDDTLPDVECLRDEINQVILNMIMNARDAIVDKGLNEKGKIIISTSHTDSDVIITINDTGCGIPEKIRKRIYDPFFTTKEVGRGSGQGLAISHSIVTNKHHGKLSEMSEVGKGTTFTIILPIRSSSNSEPVALIA